MMTQRTRLDLLAEARHLGVLTKAEATAIRTEGERVIAAIEANAPPFCDGWEDWRPDPAWIVPGIPKGWDDVGGPTGSAQGDR